MIEPVSVIIPTHNRKGFLQTALQSVLSQDHPLEVIVVDDGSADGTREAITTDDSRLRYLRQDNRGPAAARNTGIKNASFDLIAFLDSDDRFAKDKLRLQAAAMASVPEFLVSHTDEIWYRRGKHLNQKKKHRKMHGDIFARSLSLCVVGMSTVMARRRLFDEIGLFDESLPCCEDYDLWLRAGCRYPFLLVDAPLTIKEGGREDQVSVRYRVGMDRFRIRSLLGLLQSGILTAEQQRLAAAELVSKCKIYGNGCEKHGRRQEGLGYLALAQRWQSPEVDRTVDGWAESLRDDEISLTPTP